MKHLKLFEEVRYETDEELVNGIKKGSKWAENQIWGDYYDYLNGVLKRNSTGIKPDECNIIISNTFQKAISKIDTYKSVSSLKSWLTTIAMRCMYDYFDLPKKQLNMGHKEFTSDSNLGSTTTETSIDDRKVINSFTKALTERERQIFKLILSDLTAEEISKEMGITLGTAKWYKKTLVDKFREFNQKVKK